jgi:mannose-6-phosphate isomerase-like protein (cupin superfamily)
MECVTGSALVEIEDAGRMVKAGDRYLVEAHKRHSVRPLELGTVLRCVHEHADIQPGSDELIPIEWLHRLTAKEPAHA